MKFKSLIAASLILFASLPVSAGWYVEFRSSDGAYGWGESLDYNAAYNRAYKECSVYSWSCYFYHSEWR